MKTIFKRNHLIPGNAGNLTAEELVKQCNSEDYSYIMIVNMNKIGHGYIPDGNFIFSQITYLTKMDKFNYQNKKIQTDNIICTNNNIEVNFNDIKQVIELSEEESILWSLILKK